MRYEERTSEELMPLVASGDKRAFSCLMARHKCAVYGIAYRFFGNRAEAEDVFQEVFLRVWRSAGSYTPTAKFSTWLYTIAANQCKSELASLWRKHIRLIGSLWSEEGQEVFTVSAPSSEDIAARGEEAETVRRAIGALPPKQRLALILSRYEGLSYEEVGEAMQCSVASVESLLFRARKTVQKNLRCMIDSEG